MTRPDPIEHKGFIELPDIFDDEAVISALKRGAYGIWDALSPELRARIRQSDFDSEDGLEEVADLLYELLNGEELPADPLDEDPR